MSIELQALHESWTPEATRLTKEGFCKAQDPSILQTIFGDRYDFPQELAPIRRRIAEKEHAESDRAWLIQLQERIDTIGCQIFIEKQDSIFPCKRPEILSDYCLRIFAPTRLSKPAMINKGLPNDNGKLCWLNASIFYLAATDYYDYFVSKPDPTGKSEGLRQTLFRLINALRKNSHQAIITALHKELLQELHNGGFCELLRDQQDGTEFLTLLQDRLSVERKPDERIKSITLYTSKQENIVKPAKEHDEAPTIVMSPPHEESYDESIDVGKCISKESERIGVTEYITTTVASNPGPQSPKDFIAQNIYTQLPDVFEIYLKRGVGSIQIDDQWIVPHPRLKIEPDGTLELMQHVPMKTEIQDKEVIIGSVPTCLVKYKVQASIEHSGDTSESGHYRTYARIADGTISGYSDLDVSRGHSETVWANGYLVQLKCIERTYLLPDRVH
jgi:hypothetical protein